MASVSRRIIRILHVVGGMNRGGIETWLMHILRHIDRDRFQMDFLVHTTQPCAYDEEIRTFGSKIIPCLDPSRPWLYARNFKHILREYGHYDIVHSHVHHFSGYVLHLARNADVPVRIAHCHNDTSLVKSKSRFFRRLYLGLTEWWITRNATFGIACSRNAAADLFGSNWELDPRWQLLYYGIDLKSFELSVDKDRVRTELGIPSNAFVIGHIGRFDPQKNHEFLIEVFSAIAQQKPSAYLLLIGDGSLRSNVEQQVFQLDLADRVIFGGIRADIPRLMLAAMDVFILPSLHEGLPLVLLEAQSAGLPCIFSDAITDEVRVIQPLLTSISLSQSVSDWAETVLNIKFKQIVPAQINTYKLLEKSDFNIEASIKKLTNIYESKIYT